MCSNAFSPVYVAQRERHDDFADQTNDVGIGAAPRAAQALAYLKQASCMSRPEHVSRRSNAARNGGRRHFKTVGDAPRPVDEQRGRLRRADLARGLFEQIEPAVEMITDQVERNMGPHRRAMIAT